MFIKYSKLNKYMGKTTILMLLVFIVTLSFVSAEQQSLGTIKQNDCVRLYETCTNCTTIVISSIIYPNKTQSAVTIPMTTTDNFEWAYNYCNTSTLGQYIVNGYGDANGVNTGFGYDFVVNGSGQEVTGSQITLIIIGVIVMLIVCAFFFILSMLFKHPGTKIFLMALSSLTLIILIGIIASNATVYLAEFPNLVAMYNQYYIMVIILAGAAMAGIILWLIYYSVKLFNGARGRTPDDD